MQFYRGTAAQNEVYVGKAGEITVDTTAKTIHMHDGVTAGGTVAAKGDPATLYMEGNVMEGAYFSAPVIVADGVIDVSKGRVFVLQPGGDTAYSLTNLPPAGYGAYITLVIVNGGQQAITWPANVKWFAGNPPTLTQVGRDVLALGTNNNGVWYGDHVGHYTY